MNALAFIRGKYLAPLVLVIATIGLLAYKARADGQEQIAIITGFYKSYVTNRDRLRNDDLLGGSFYSKNVEALLAINRERCENPSRSDEVCGYGADGDVVLNTQETTDNLTFEKLRFKATRFGVNTIDVSFNVFPEYGEDYDRRIRYIFVKENGEWRVDNVYFASDSGFTASESLRVQVQQENEQTLISNRDVADTANKIFSYLSDDDGLHYIEERMAFPVQICDRAGSCSYVRQCEVELREAFIAMRLAYYGDTKSITEFVSAPDLSVLPKQIPWAENKVVAIDALDFTFRHNAWRVTTIDLRRLGTTVRAQKIADRPPVTAPQ
jgi:hypothetical protein